MFKRNLFIILMISAFLFIRPAAAYGLTLPTEPAAVESMAPPSRVVIADYAVEGGGLAAGKTVTAEFTLRNTGASAYVNSVLVTGWIDSASPVEFIGVNQAYVASIRPRGEAVVRFTYYTRDVDLSGVGSISAGFAITYGDEGSAVERTNNVSVRLPVLRADAARWDESDFYWPEPQDTALDTFLYSRRMQFVYAAGLACSGFFILVLFVLKASRKP